MHSTRKAENYTPAEQAIFDSMVRAIAVKHEAWRTGQTYGAAVVWYFRFLKKHPELRDKSSEDKVVAYLTDMAPHCAAKTQNQRLCAPQLPRVKRWTPRGCNLAGGGRLGGSRVAAGGGFGREGAFQQAGVRWVEGKFAGVVSCWEGAS